MSSIAKQAKGQSPQHFDSTKSKDEIKLKGVYWSSSLFNDVYIDQKITKNGVVDGDEFFEKCHSDLLDLFQSKSENQMQGWTETETITKWVIPVLRSLSWSEGEESDPFAQETSFTVLEEGKNKTYRADILIADGIEELGFFANRRLKADERLSKAKKHVMLPVEAKYWGRIKKQYANKLDKSEEAKKADLQLDDTKSLSPNRQTLKYMEILNSDWGILTDGATWRLFNKDISQAADNRFLEFNMYALYKIGRRATDHEVDALIFREAVRFFYQFFSKPCLYGKNRSNEFVKKALSATRTYAEHVEEDLQYRFLSAMNIVCNGFNKSSKKTKIDLNLVRTSAESFLFNILFIKSCEARGVLNLKIEDYWNKSLSKLIERLHVFDPQKYEESPKFFDGLLKSAFDWFEYSDDGTELFDHLINLKEMIDNGTNGKSSGFYIEGFKESVFNEEEWAFVGKNKLSNKVMVRTLFELGFTKAEKDSGLDFQEIPYSYFTPRQLGSIYESFLEFKLTIAESDLAFVNKQWKEANLKSEKVLKMHVPKVRSGELFFTPDNVDRKATGSYYTPDYIVKHIVKETLDPICKDITADGILNLRVCDPAMGSGHFLTGVLQYLNDKYMAALDDEILDDVNMTPEEGKRIVLDKCIFGVDLNPSATKLAKMSLWLDSAHPGKKLERLEDQVQCFDSLMDEKSWSSLLKKVGSKFDAVVGNPPYKLVGSDEPDKQEFFKRNYSLIRYKINTYVLFLEKGFNLLKQDSGRIGFIIPKSLLFNTFFKETRLELVKRFKLNHIIDIQGKVFKDAEVGDSIILLGQNKNINKYSFKISSASIGDESLTLGKSNEVHSHKVIENGGEFTQKSTSSSDLTFKDVCDIFNGLNPGNVKHILLSRTKSSGKHKKMILGRDIKPFGLEWSGTWVNFDPDLKNKIKLSDIKSKKGMTAQKKVDFALRKEAIYLGDKIIVRKTGDRIIAAMDSESFYYDSLSYGIKLKPTTKVSIHFVLGILMSDYIQEHHEKISNNKGKVFAKVLLQNLEKLPFPDIKISDSASKGSHDRIVKIVKSLASLGGDVSTKQQKYMLEMNEEVNDLFGVGRSRKKAA